MKSTYKILSEFLDGISLPDKPIVTEYPQESIPLVGEDYCLLDINEYKRRISGSYLLEIPKEEQLYDLFSVNQNCDCMFIQMDYDSLIGTAMILYIKRILQALYLLSNKYPNTEFILSTEKERVDELNSYLEMLYNKNK